MAAAQKYPKKLLKIPELEQRIAEEAGKLLDALMDLALGHYVTVSKFNKFTGQAETRIYDEPPDRGALIFLLENYMGKVPNRLEITGEGGGPVKIIPYMTMAEAQRTGILQVAQLEQARLDKAEVEGNTVDAEYAEVSSDV